MGTELEDSVMCFWLSPCLSIFLTSHFEHVLQVNNLGAYSTVLRAPREIEAHEIPSNITPLLLVSTSKTNPTNTQTHVSTPLLLKRPHPLPPPIPQHLHPTFSLLTMSSTDPPSHIPWTPTTNFSPAHIATDLRWFTTYTPFPSHLGNPDTRLPARGIGTVVLDIRTSLYDPFASKKLVLRDVLYVPEGVRLNLFSEGLLRKKMGLEIKRSFGEMEWVEESVAGERIGREGWVAGQSVRRGADGGREVSIKRGEGWWLVRSGTGEKVFLLAGSPGRLRLWLKGTEGQGEEVRGRAERRHLEFVNCFWVDSERERWEKFREEFGEGGDGGWNAEDGVEDEEEDMGEGGGDGPAVDAAVNAPTSASSADSENRISLTDVELAWVEENYDSTQDFLSFSQLPSDTDEDWNRAVALIREEMAADVKDDDRRQHAIEECTRDEQEADARRSRSHLDWLSSLHTGYADCETLCVAHGLDPENIEHRPKAMRILREEEARINERTGFVTKEHAYEGKGKGRVEE